MTLVYLDTETTGLDPLKHEIWEIAYAVDDGPIRTAIVAHHGMTADDKALEIGQYWARISSEPTTGRIFERDLIELFEGKTLVGANPAFDAKFLNARWGRAPWKYRLFDIEAYAMPALGINVPVGLNAVTTELRERWHADIPTPDHTAAGDVATLRACHVALQAIYAGWGK